MVVRAIPLSQRARLTRLPAGLVGFSRLVGVRDTGRSSTSVVTLRFGLAPTDLAAVRTSALAVYEDDPPGNKKVWQVVPGTRLLPGGQVEITLTDPQIASGSDARFATYAPLAPPNLAPVIAAVYPAQGARVRGRTQLLSAAVGDDELLNTGRFALFVDGKRRGGVSFRNGNVIFRIGGLAPGGHRAALLVVDQSGLRTTRAWTFTVLNGRPTILRRRALPRPGSFVLTRGVVRVRIPVRDDQRVVRALTRVRVDGRVVRARVVRGPARGPGAAGPGPPPDRRARGRPRRGGRHPRLGLPHRPPLTPWPGGPARRASIAGAWTNRSIPPGPRAAGGWTGASSSPPSSAARWSCWCWCCSSSGWPTGASAPASTTRWTPASAWPPPPSACRCSRPAPPAGSRRPAGG